MTAVADKWSCRGRVLDLSTPVVMGVLNVTPDSFSDGGKFAGPSAALNHAHQMIEAGASIIDVGGESTRPGATPVSVDEELARVIPIIETLRENADVFISVDTSKSEVMQASIAAGADIINDVRALLAPGALTVASSSRAGVCLMHMQGDPRNMQVSPHYVDVVQEVGDFLERRIATCIAGGIELATLVADPGFGFGKSIDDNLTLLHGLAALRRLGVPIAVGLSRKSMLAKMTGRDPVNRTAGSVALAAIAVLNGARIVRAHDVAATLDAVRVAAAIRQGEKFDGT
jgi:dihydropteroate synthase